MTDNFLNLEFGATVLILHRVTGPVEPFDRRGGAVAERVLDVGEGGHVGAVVENVGILGELNLILTRLTVNLHFGI